MIFSKLWRGKFRTLASLGALAAGLAVSGCQSSGTPQIAAVLSVAEGDGTAPVADTTTSATPSKSSSSPAKRPPAELTVPKVDAPAVAGIEQAEPTVTALAAKPARRTNPFQAFVAQSRDTRRRQAAIRRARTEAAKARRAKKTGDTARSKVDIRKSKTNSKSRRVAVVVDRQTGSVRSASRRPSVGLPGVDTNTLFGIEDEEEEATTTPSVGPRARQVAAVTNLARRGNHGLLLQNSGVQVGCFGPDLIAILKKVERKFGRSPIITSGYRSPSRNRAARGARRSSHLSCKAADLQVKGVSKHTLAKYLRTLPGRGGVGTYCHTESVHVDTGPQRSWHHCKRRRKKRKG